jgi:hypothetical protein
MTKGMKSRLARLDDMITGELQPGESYCVFLFSGEKLDIGSNLSEAAFQGFLETLSAQAEDHKDLVRMPAEGNC